MGSVWEAGDWPSVFSTSSIFYCCNTNKKEKSEIATSRAESKVTCCKKIELHKLPDMTFLDVLVGHVVGVV